MLLPLLVACSGTVDLQVSGSADKGIIFKLSSDDAKKFETGFKFYVMESGAVSNGELKTIMWEIELFKRNEWLNFKQDYIEKWAYGIQPNGFNEIVKPKPLVLNTNYYYSMSGGRGYSGAGCFYLDDKRKVVNSLSC